MPTEKPTIIIIPASFSILRWYEAVISELESHGYPVHGIELETVGVRSKAPGLYDDAAKVAALVSQLAEEGKDVVLVPHSYGGLVACEAAKGLAKSVRKKEGKKGGIVRIVFTTSVVGLEGQSLTDVMADSEVKLDYIGLEGEYMTIDTAGCAPVLFNDLSPEEGLSWASQMPNHSAISFAQKLTYGAYKDIPVSYLFCERDECITPKKQTQIIAAMESQMGGKTVDRHSVQADHAINVSQPKTMVAVIRKALGDTV
ncbi:AB hydrolase-1 domain-containing protein [Mycena sanguinolenta]|uniref:AB hydrolase-1 domain-containing protein n=1 Tax=Mycena sanguinolenta TaxID=230812 RepID=A0A8H7D440_9AGAR|nr:AB hydrolase-1 domain-containing protein [Mycena sanguinolenta]